MGGGLSFTISDSMRVALSRIQKEMAPKIAGDVPITSMYQVLAKLDHGIQGNGYDQGLLGREVSGGLVARPRDAVRALPNYQPGSVFERDEGRQWADSGGDVATMRLAESHNIEIVVVLGSSSGRVRVRTLMSGDVLGENVRRVSCDEVGEYPLAQGDGVRDQRRGTTRGGCVGEGRHT